MCICSKPLSHLVDWQLVWDLMLCIAFRPSILIVRCACLCRITVDKQLALDTLRQHVWWQATRLASEIPEDEDDEFGSMAIEASSPDSDGDSEPEEGELPIIGE